MFLFFSFLGFFFFFLPHSLPSVVGFFLMCMSNMNVWGLFVCGCVFSLGLLCAVVGGLVWV